MSDKIPLTTSQIIALGTLLVIGAETRLQIHYIEKDLQTFGAYATASWDTVQTLKHDTASRLEIDKLADAVNAQNASMWDAIEELRSEVRHTDRVNGTRTARLARQVKHLSAAPSPIARPPRKPSRPKWKQPPIYGR